ncbi:MAG: hypothetical protein NTW25_08760 [Candidatus Kapabacteria bacterium]|nr:hypothetical protein [Candidatus Kapabacteria bacterium]
MKRQSHYLILLTLSTLTFTSCVQTPTSPISSKVEDSFNNVAFILCEGLWGSNNSRLDKYLIDSTIIIKDYYSLINNIKLGDTAFDIKRKGDTAYISITTSKSIEIFNLKTGKFINRIILNTNSALRSLTIVNDTIGFVSDLYQKQVIKFNPTTFQIITNIPVGPAPEGLANDGTSLFVANSGYGDYLKDAPKAGTISKIDFNSNLETANVFCGNNIIEVHYSKINNKVYGVYKNLPSLTQLDSMGGIVEFYATTLVKTYEWRDSITRSLVFKNKLYYINKAGLWEIDLNSTSHFKVHLLTNTKDENWYGLQINPSETEIWICNAKNYQISGEVLVFNLSSKQVTKIIPTGTNPNNILFY